MPADGMLPPQNAAVAVVAGVLAADDHRENRAENAIAGIVTVTDFPRRVALPVAMMPADLSATVNVQQRDFRPVNQPRGDLDASSATASAQVPHAAAAAARGLARSVTLADAATWNAAFKTADQPEFRDNTKGKSPEYSGLFHVSDVCTY